MMYTAACNMCLGSTKILGINTVTFIFKDSYFPIGNRISPEIQDSNTSGTTDFN